MVKGLGSIGWRSFFVQAAKNYRTMLGMGYSFATRPLISDLSEDKHRDARAQASSFFNTHPYLVPLSIGIEARCRAEGGDEERVAYIKTSVMGPFGALGDSFFWATAKPFAVVIGLLVALWHSPLWGALLVLLLFNMLHLPIRLWGAYLGYNMYVETPGKLNQLKPHLVMLVMRYIIGIALGIVLAGFLGSALFTSACPAIILSIGWGLAATLLCSWCSIPVWLRWFVIAGGAILLGLMVPCLSG